jgi:outer membrane lipoprotein SlyB
MMNLPKKMLFGLFTLLVLLPPGFSATVAQAQQPVYSTAAPRIDGFDVEPAPRLVPGNELLFTLYGSPGGTATIQISGVVDKYRLEEVEPGVYEGTYTIKSRDRITADVMVTANLRLGNRIASAVLDESILAGAASRSDAQRAADVALAAAPRIDRFDIDPAPRLDSGANLFFSLAGTPGGTASVRIGGVKGKVSLPEVAAGVYEGSYVIKDRDRIAANSAVTATLRRGEREASAVLGQSLLASDGRMPSARAAAISCANCGVIESINAVEVAGEGGYVGKIAGGVLGAVLGSQVGQGRGRTAAEIAGAVGGAVAGNEVEKRTKKTKHYDVTVRLQNGGTQTISYATEPTFRVGDRIRVEGGALVPN